MTPIHISANPLAPKIAVIGAGLGGMTSAMLLAHAGCKVTVFDKLNHPGGKLGHHEWQGFQWDTGPSLLTMPHVLRELWSLIGANFDNEVTLNQLLTTCRYRWEDGTIIDENTEFWQRNDVANFLQHAKGIYELSEHVFLSQPLKHWWKCLTPKQLKNLRHLPKIANPRPMAHTLNSFFPDSPHLRQLFGRFATYNGSSPYKAPSAFNIIAYVQAHFGAYYVQGGFRRLAMTMESRCRVAGAQFAYNQEVTRIKPHKTGYHLTSANASHTNAFFDGIICNQDTLEATKRFLNPQFKPKAPLSSSAFIILAAVSQSYPELAHHNIFFSTDYPSEFKAIFDTPHPVENPTIYLCIDSKSESTRAPNGMENWFILVNAPPTHENIRWPDIAESYADAILARLHNYGIANPIPHILHRKIFSPTDLESRFAMMGGALYGYASHSTLSAFARPPMCPANHPHFVFTGGSTHPGGGIPLVVRSGQMAANELLRQLNIPFPYTHNA